MQKNFQINFKHQSVGQKGHQLLIGLIDVLNTISLPDNLLEHQINRINDTI